MTAIYLFFNSFRMVFNGGQGSLTWPSIFASWRAEMSLPNSWQNQAGGKVKPFFLPKKSPLMPILALLSWWKCPRGSAKRGGITSAWARLLKLFKFSFLVLSQLTGLNSLENPKAWKYSWVVRVSRWTRWTRFLKSNLWDFCSFDGVEDAAETP